MSRYLYRSSHHSLLECVRVRDSGALLRSKPNVENSQYIKCIIRSAARFTSRRRLIDERCCLSSMHPVNQNILSKTSSVEPVFISGGCMRSARLRRVRGNTGGDALREIRFIIDGVYAPLGYRGRSSHARFIWIIVQNYSPARGVFTRH